MYFDIQFQITWQHINYVVESLSPDENPVPNVSSYNDAKSCKHGTLSNFLGYGVNNDCQNFHPACIENCISDNKR